MSLLLLCALVYLPGLWSIPPVDRDECRFAQASRQMLESLTLPQEQLDLRMSDDGVPLGAHAGGVVVPMVQNRVRINKPPLVYWLQAGSAWVFSGGDAARDAIWMYRLPSAVCAALTVLITWRIGLRLFDARAAWLGAAMLAVSPMVAWDAHQARADQLLLLCTTAAMGCMARILVDRERRTSVWWSVGLWMAVGMGVLAKGFITPLVVLTTLAALMVAGRSWAPIRAVRPLLGLLIVVLCVAPWVVLLAKTIGLEVFAREVWTEVFLRAATGTKDGRRTFLPPGVHALLTGVLLWPACMVLVPAIATALDRAWGQHQTGSFWTRVRLRMAMVSKPAAGRAPELFLLCWIIPAWLVFELSPAKLPHYTMPLYPALSLLSARSLLAAQARLRIPGRIGVWSWFSVAAGVPLLLAGAVWISDLADAARVSALVFVIGLIGLPVWGVMLVAVQFLRGHRWVSAAVAGLCAVGYMLPVSLHAVAPHLVRGEKPKLLSGNLTERVFRVVRQIDPTGVRPLASVYHEDSVVFQSRGRVIKIRAADQQAWLAENPGGILIGTLKVDAPGRDAWEIRPYAVLSPVRQVDGSLVPSSPNQSAP